MFRRHPLLAGSLLLVLWPLASRPALAQPGPRPGPRAIVFVANGAGGSEAASKMLGCVVKKNGLPIEVVTIGWSTQDLVLDVRDLANHREAGRDLARKVLAARLAYPWRRVCLLGHSAGCAVILAAAEALPPGIVDRVILLAPGSSPYHDLRPALAHVSEGIDVYYSQEDAVLDVFMDFVGTTDGPPTPAAGSVGFAQFVSCPADLALYSKLRQYPYGPAFFWTGNEGGHYGWLRCRFLRAYVVPAVLGTDRFALPHHPAVP